MKRETALDIRKSEDYPTVGYDDWLRMFLKAGQPDDGSPVERVVEEPVDVYRGEIDGSHHLSMSWTTDCVVARKFATRFGKDGRLFCTTVTPDMVLAAYRNDPEREVLVDVSRLGDVTELDL